MAASKHGSCTHYKQLTRLWATTICPKTKKKQNCWYPDNPVYKQTHTHYSLQSLDLVSKRKTKVLRICPISIRGNGFPIADSLTLQIQHYRYCASTNRSHKHPNIASQKSLKYTSTGEYTLKAVSRSSQWSWIQARLICTCVTSNTYIVRLCECNSMLTCTIIYMRGWCLVVEACISTYYRRWYKHEQSPISWQGHKLPSSNSLWSCPQLCEAYFGLQTRYATYHIQKRL